MSVTLTPQQTLCPRCGAELAIPTIGVGQEVICAECRHRFVPAWLAVVSRMSRKAVASLVLGLASLLGICLTGFPAIALGIFALVDIHRGKGRVTGKKIAVLGIVTGAILGTVYVPVWLALGFPLTQMLRGGSRVEFASATRVELANESQQLDNGLTVLLRPVQGVPNVAVVVLYSVGGDHDPEDQSGLAHLIEHLYVTAAAGSIPARTADDFMRKYPAGWNAQTGDQFTVIATVFPKESLEAELEEAAARMSDLRITAADLDREKPRLIQEVQNMFGGAAQLVAYNHARERVRPTPLGGRKAGVPERVSAVSLESVQDRVRRFYKPKNATLVVAGAIDSTAVQSAITKHFAKLPAGEPTPEAAEPGKPKPTKEIELVSAKAFVPGAPAELCVAYPAPPRDSELYPAFLVLVGRLGARAQQLNAGPNRFPLDYSPIFDSSSLLIPIPLQPGESAEQAAARVDSFIADALKPPLSAADRLIAKNRFAIELRTTQLPDAAVAQNLYFLAFATGRRAILGLDAIDYGKAIDSVTTEQLRQAGETSFSGQRRVVVVAKPE